MILFLCKVQARQNQKNIKEMKKKKKMKKAPPPHPSATLTLACSYRSNDISRYDSDKFLMRAHTYTHTQHTHTHQHMHIYRLNSGETRKLQSGQVK